MPYREHAANPALLPPIRPEEAGASREPARGLDAQGRGSKTGYAKMAVGVLIYLLGTWYLWPGFAN